MRRWIAVLWHASFFVIAGALYFFFVLPRWLELTGAWPVGLGLSMRIVCGVLIGLAALPVVFTLLRTRKPEFGTPQLALSLRFWSIVLHVLAAVLIVGAAISEIWLSLDSAGTYLFGVYGAAAAIAVLGALGFYLAFAAELPPPPPKPIRPKSQTRRRGRGRAAEAEDAGDQAEDEVEVVTETPASEPNSADADVADAPDTDETTEVEEVQETPAEVPMSTVTVDEDSDYEADEPETSSNGSGNADDSSADEQGSKLRNRRSGGRQTSRLFGRSRRGVALDD